MAAYHHNFGNIVLVYFELFNVYDTCIGAIRGIFHGKIAVFHLSDSTCIEGVTKFEFQISPQLFSKFFRVLSVFQSNIQIMIDKISHNIVQNIYEIFDFFFAVMSLYKFTINIHIHTNNNIPKNIVENVCTSFTAVHQSIHILLRLDGFFIK